METEGLHGADTGFKPSKSSWSKTKEHVATANNEQLNTLVERIGQLDAQKRSMLEAHSDLSRLRTLADKPQDIEQAEKFIQELQTASSEQAESIAKSLAELLEV